MSARPNYFKIGVFVVIGVVLIVTGLIMFGAGVFSEKKMYIETYFEGSVSGLNIGSDLQDRGVKIGRVERIAFAVPEYNLQPGTPEFRKFQPYVMVVCSMQPSVFPSFKTVNLDDRFKLAVERGYRLRLSTNMLTGQATIEGSFLDPVVYPELQVPWKPKYFYIPSAVGEMTTLKDAVGRMLPAMTRLVDTLDKSVAEANLPAVMKQANGLLADLRETNKQLQTVLNDPNIKQIPGQLAQTVARTNAAMARLDAAMAGGRPEFDQFMANLRDLSANLRDLSEDLKANPSDIIFSKPPKKEELK
jgi:ABC-type transporter Mla subunit MlaD